MPAAISYPELIRLMIITHPQALCHLLMWMSVNIHNLGCELIVFRGVTLCELLCRRERVRYGDRNATCNNNADEPTSQYTDRWRKFRFPRPCLWRFTQRLFSQLYTVTQRPTSAFLFFLWNPLIMGKCFMAFLLLLHNSVSFCNTNHFTHTRDKVSWAGMQIYSVIAQCVVVPAVPDHSQGLVKQTFHINCLKDVFDCWYGDIFCEMFL